MWTTLAFSLISQTQGTLYLLCLTSCLLSTRPGLNAGWQEKQKIQPVVKLESPGTRGRMQKSKAQA